jgi:hypothetical protein
METKVFTEKAENSEEIEDILCNIRNLLERLILQKKKAIVEVYTSTKPNKPAEAVYY